MSVYNDYYIDNEHYRVFSLSASEETELEWHRDKGDRVVSVVEGSGWLFQFDNELPFEMTDNLHIVIHDGVYHRIHKGYDDLVICIKEQK